MTYRIEFSNDAKKDLNDSYDYIASVLKNAAAAKRFIETAQKGIFSLDTFPERNPLMRDSFLSSKGVRMHIIKNYIAFYVIHDDIHTVYILRVIHSKQDWLSILKNDFLTNT